MYPEIWNYFTLMYERRCHHKNERKSFFARIFGSSTFMNAYKKAENENQEDDYESKVKSMLGATYAKKSVMMKNNLKGTINDIIKELETKYNDKKKAIETQDYYDTGVVFNDCDVNHCGALYNVFSWFSYLLEFGIAWNLWRNNYDNVECDNIKHLSIALIVFACYLKQKNNEEKIEKIEKIENELKLINFDFEKKKIKPEDNFLSKKIEPENDYQPYHTKTTYLYYLYKKYYLSIKNIENVEETINKFKQLSSEEGEEKINEIIRTVTNVINEVISKSYYSKS